jgi:hypothetical protein
MVAGRGVATSAAIAGRAALSAFDGERPVDLGHDVVETWIAREDPETGDRRRGAARSFDAILGYCHGGSVLDVGCAITRITGGMGEAGIGIWDGSG